MIQKTIITTLLALLSGAPFLKAQTIDTTSADTPISITDSLVWELAKVLKTELKEKNATAYSGSASLRNKIKLENITL